MKKTTILLTILALCMCAWAADNAVIAPRAVTGFKPQTTTYGVESITIPQMMSYQGKLTDTLGVPVADTLYAIRFRLYAQATGGTHFWEENQQVRTSDGLFSTLLGSATPIGSVPDAGALYLGMAVAGGAELTPRLRIASAAYSYLTERAANADLLQGKDTTGFVRTGQANSVTSAMLVDGTVLTADVGDTAVTMAKLARAGAATGEVVKWTGSAWAPGQDNTGGGSGVTNVYQDTGITCVPNPITSTGNVKLNLSYTDGRYVNEAQAAGGDLTGT